MSIPMIILSFIATCKPPKRKPDKRKLAFAIACFGLILGMFFFSVCYVGISALEFAGIVQPQLSGYIVLGQIVARKISGMRTLIFRRPLPISLPSLLSQ